MNDYISREAVLQKFLERGSGYINMLAMRDMINEIPAADVQPTNRWIDAQKNPPPIVDRRSMTSESVLIQIDNGRCAVAYYCYDDEDGNCWVTDDEKTIYDLEEVTRWQPLPEKDGDTE